MSDSLQRRIRERLEAEPEQRALAIVDAHGVGRWWTRRELHERCARVATKLIESKLAPGGVVVIVSIDPTECATSVLAALLCGAVPLLAAPPTIQGVNSSLTSILDEVIRRSRASLVILPRAMAARADALAAAFPSACIEPGFERLLAESGSIDKDFAVPARAERHGSVAILQQTSGTTRFPRIAVLEHARVLAAVDGMARGMKLASDDVYLNWTPLYHDMGLVNNFLTCLVHGIPLALLSALDVVRRPALWMRALDDLGATQTWSPNFGYALAAQRCSDEELEGLDLSRVRGCWNAAERVHLETFKRFHARFERQGARWTACKTDFGCVESIGGATFSSAAGPLVAEELDLDCLQEESNARIADDATRRAQWFVSCGRAYPGLELGIFDEHGQRLPDGRVGELGLRGEARFECYLDDPEQTARTKRDGFVFPGDEGYLRDGEFFWTGRSSERINLQGKKLDPSELEQALLGVRGLRRGCFAAFGVEDVERGTELLVVLVEVEVEAQSRLAEIAGEIRRKLAIEVGVVVEDLRLLPKGTLTKTSSGKRRQRHFRELYLNRNPLLNGLQSNDDRGADQGEHEQQGGEPVGQVTEH